MYIYIYIYIYLSLLLVVVVVVASGSAAVDLGRQAALQLLGDVVGNYINYICIYR